MTHKLIGKVVKSIYLADDKKAIRFYLDNDKTIFAVARCYEDCCAETWIENIEDPENIINLPVVCVDNLPFFRDDEKNDGKLIKFYGCKITTNKGDCIIDYRNSSDGYYGGNLHWTSSNSNIDMMGWKKII